MKTLLKSVLVILLFVSWNSEAKKTGNELPNEIEIIHENNEPSEGQKVAVILSEITPLSEAELRNAFPKQLKDLPVDKNIKVIGQQVIGSFGDKKISMSIADAAGSNNQLAAHMMDSYAYNKHEEIENFKVVKQERNGMETLTDYYKKTGKSEMRFLHKRRFYITLSNNDNLIELNPDELWDAFDINALNGYNEMNK